MSGMKMNFTPQNDGPGCDQSKKFSTASSLQSHSTDDLNCNCDNCYLRSSSSLVGITLAARLGQVEGNEYRSEGNE